MNSQQRPKDPVKHVVLLMFENHSFDQMFGCFKQLHADLAGVEATNPLLLSAICARTFIEPDYNGVTENDDHPPHDVMKAQKLLADVYNALRANPELWASTLLVLLYHEHGGFYDHVEPPAAVPPDNHHEEYTFDRLGIRVPALLVLPRVEQGFDATACDHTSLLKYLSEKWGLGPLAERSMAKLSTVWVNSPFTLSQSPSRSGILCLRIDSMFVKFSFSSSAASLTALVCQSTDSLYWPFCA
jgi:phospholipase C